MLVFVYNPRRAFGRVVQCRLSKLMGTELISVSVAALFWPFEV